MVKVNKMIINITKTMYTGELPMYLLYLYCTKLTTVILRYVIHHSLYSIYRKAFTVTMVYIIMCVYDLSIWNNGYMPIFIIIIAINKNIIVEACKIQTSSLDGIQFFQIIII